MSFIIMKCVILAGGYGTRISEETALKPKPMIEIGGFPLLWHLMKTYSSYGINDFVICCGYKGYVIKEYFANYFLHTSDVTFDMQKNEMEVHKQNAEPWKVTLIDTGVDTMTGGRLKKVQKFVENETFCFTYGDGLSNVDITKLVQFHKDQKKFATTTSVQAPGRYGQLKIVNNDVVEFVEKPLGDGSWINGGFFVCQPSVLDYIDGDETMFEKEPLSNLAIDSQLMAFKHEGFWQSMDTLRDKKILCSLWDNKNAPWKNWS